MLLMVAADATPPNVSSVTTTARVSSADFFTRLAPVLFLGIPRKTYWLATYFDDIPHFQQTGRLPYNPAEICSCQYSTETLATRGIASSNHFRALTSPA